LIEIDRGRHLFEAADHTRGRCLIHLSLANIHGECGRAAKGLAEGMTALRLAERLGDPAVRASAFNAVGLSHFMLGQPQRALEFLEPALTLSQTHTSNTERYILDSLARTYGLLGRHADATACYRQALDLYQRIGDRRGVGMVLAGLGDTYAATGDDAAARTAWRRALDIYRTIDHPDTDAMINRLAHN
jgi:tetratricopeptide (TPR) repeat protein